MSLQARQAKSETTANLGADLNGNGCQWRCSCCHWLLPQLGLLNRFMGLAGWGASKSTCGMLGVLSSPFAGCDWVFLLWIAPGCSGCNSVISPLTRR